MFSELCRETLRKAAVCYSSGRSSASPSPSPPSSPPPSPSRQTTSQQPRHHRHHHHCQQQEGPVETRSVGCYANHERDREPLGRLARRAIGTGEFCEKRPAAPTNVSSRRTSGLESRDGRRLPYAATTDYYFSDLPSSRDHNHHHHHHHRHHHHHQYHRRHRHQYHQHTHGHHCHRRVRSASPEMLRSSGRQEPDEQQNYESSGSSSEPDDNSSGDEAGAVPDENSQRSNSAHNRHSLTKGRESTTGGNDAAAAANRTKEIDRARLVRERQNEERQRKLEELREQALAAQRFREQREEDRRRRIEELRNRDYDRRSQVEERKRMIWEAEHARREAILRKNQEREARIEAKRKNERSHIVFAFGSSTPRMLEPADTGGASFWGTRRATSTSNVMSFSATGPHQPLTRRSSERELDAGSKKRATSAGGLDRKPGEGIRSGEATPSSPSRPHSSMSQQSGTSSVASGSVSLRPRAPTPRRPRPASIAGTGVTSGTAGGYERNNAAEAKSQKDSSKPPLPAKLHGSGQPRKPSSGATRSSASTSASTTAGTGERLAGVAGQATAARSARASPRITPRATPPQSPGAEQQSPPEAGASRAEPPRQLVKLEEKPLGPRAEEEEEQAEEEAAAVVLLVEEKEEERPGLEQLKQVAPKIPDSEPSVKDEAAAAGKKEEEEQQQQQKQPAAAIAEPTSTAPASLDEAPRQHHQQQHQQSLPSPAADKRAEKKLPAENEARAEAELDEQCDMTASMIQKIRITTEEEAKAALAERRRLAREQAEREAELERQRLEEEARLEAERLRAEEEEQRRLEEETLRLAQEAREAEEQRLRLAIEEAQKREEEDRKRREEEARQKLEKEEAERKAREEAEKLRLEMVERLKKEEAERNARRKRVEAIMSRTRAKNQPNTPNKGEGNDGEKSKEDSPTDESKPTPGEKAVQDLMTTSLISEATQQFISSEQRAHCAETNNAEESGKTVVRNGTHANGISEQSSTKPTDLDNDDNNGPQEFNGHHNNTNHGNGIGAQTIALDNATVKQNNATNNLLLDLADFDALGNSNGAGPILLMQPRSGGGGGVLVHEDSLNSNLSPTAMPFVPGFGLMPGAPGVNAFQEAFAGGKQQDNQVTDLLS